MNWRDAYRLLGITPGSDSWSCMNNTQDRNTVQWLQEKTKGLRSAEYLLRGLSYRRHPSRLSRRHDWRAASAVFPPKLPRMTAAWGRWMTQSYPAVRWSIDLGPNCQNLGCWVAWLYRTLPFNIKACKLPALQMRVTSRVLKRITQVGYNFSSTSITAICQRITITLLANYATNN